MASNLSDRGVVSPAAHFSAVRTEVSASAAMRSASPPHSANSTLSVREKPLVTKRPHFWDGGFAAETRAVHAAPCNRETFECKCIQPRTTPR